MSKKPGNVILKEIGSFVKYLFNVHSEVIFLVGLMLFIDNYNSSRFTVGSVIFIVGMLLMVIVGYYWTRKVIKLQERTDKLEEGLLAHKEYMENRRKEKGE